MNETFIIDDNDKGLSIKFKSEANILLASLYNGSPEYNYKKQKYEDVIQVLHSIENIEPQDEDDISFVLNTIIDFWKHPLLAPLTLNIDEFEKTPVDGKFYNKRYNHIYATNIFVYNNNAFNIYVKAAYSHIDGIQLNIEPYIEEGNHQVYISKGGIITGHNFNDCLIPPNIVAEHKYNVHKPITIPVSRIDDYDGKSIYIVDHREPMIKTLQQYYNLPIVMDTYVKDKHYNLRKYIKIKKS